MAGCTWNHGVKHATCEVSGVFPAGIGLMLLRMPTVGGAHGENAVRAYFLTLR